MALVFGLAAVHQSAVANRPHYVGYATPRSAANDTLFEVWNGDDNTARAFVVDKDGKLYSAALTAGDLVYAVTGGVTGVRRLDSLAIGTAGQALRVNAGATAPEWGAVGSAGIDDAAVTYAKIQNLDALSVLGRSANTAGVSASIAAGSDHQVLRRSGTAIGFGAVDLSQAAAVTGVLPNANTTATSANTASSIVARDASGNFTAGTITATTLAGTLSTAAQGNITSVGTLTSLAVGAITSTGLIRTTLTTQQLSLRYNASNHLAVTVGSTGLVTYAATGSGASHQFSGGTINVGADSPFSHIGFRLKQTLTASGTLAIGSYVVSTLTAAAVSDTLYGILCNPSLTAGTQAAVATVGISVGPSHSAGSGSLASSIGIQIGGTWAAATVNYGLRILDVASGTTNYAIHTGTGTVSIGDLLLTAASVAGGAKLRVPHGTAPSAPVNGDIWTTTAGLFVRINGSTVGPLS